VLSRPLLAHLPLTRLLLAGCRLSGDEPATFVVAVAKRFALACTAATQGNRRLSTKVECSTLVVEQFDRSTDQEWTVFPCGNRNV
jgi:hypothetical protein